MAVAFLGLGACFLGWRYGHWFGGKKADPDLQFGEVLDGRYMNAGETFVVDFPTQPSVVYFGSSEQGLVNYYAGDLSGRMDFRVSQMKKVTDLMGVKAETLLNDHGSLLASKITQSYLGVGGEYMVLKQQENVMELQVLSRPTDEEEQRYGLMKLMAREDNLFIISAIGREVDRAALKKFVNSFDLLKAENTDFYQIEVEELIDPNFSELPEVNYY